MTLLLSLLACADSGSFTIGPGEDPADTSGTAPVVRLTLDGAGMQDALDQAVERAGGFGGATLTVYDAQGPLFSGAAGTLVKDGEPMRPDASYEIASVTKTFTAALVLELVHEGRFGLDDPIGALLGPALPSDLLVFGGQDLGPRITVRQLLQHTSGLGDYWSDPPFVSPGTNRFLRDFLRAPDRHWTLEELASYAPGLDPISRPGEGWHYADTNYVLLGLLVERQLGTSYTEALTAKVLAPLGLDHTWMFWEQAPPAVPAISHRYEARRDLNLFEHQSADLAGGGLDSTSDDLNTFVRALAAGRLVGDPLLAELINPVPTGDAGVGYGLGVFRVDLQDRGTLWGHDGYGGAFVYVWPEQDIVMAGTVNQTEISSEPVQGAVISAVIDALQP
jgi:D-alanyl-D-alanine carboxypeptidase